MNNTYESTLQQSGFAWSENYEGCPCWFKTFDNENQLFRIFHDISQSGKFSIDWHSIGNGESWSPVGVRDSSITGWPLDKCLKWARRVQRLKSPRWEVQHETLCQDWLNTWCDDDGLQITFASEQEAQAELSEFLAERPQESAESYRVALVRQA